MRLITRQSTARILLWLGLAMVSACQTADIGVQKASAVLGPGSEMEEDSIIIRQLEASLTLWVATRAPVMGELDSVWTDNADNPGGITSDILDHVRWLAVGSAIGVDPAPDTASRRRATAVVTTVADVAENILTGGLDGKKDIRTDTVHFAIVRGPFSAGRWVVLGAPEEGFGFNFGLRGVRWLGGYSPEQARAAIDSIRLDRGLPILR